MSEDVGGLFVGQLVLHFLRHLAHEPAGGVGERARPR